MIVSQQPPYDPIVFCFLYTKNNIRTSLAYNFKQGLKNKACSITVLIKVKINKMLTMTLGKKTNFNDMRGVLKCLGTTQMFNDDNDDEAQLERNVDRVTKHIYFPHNERKNIFRNVKISFNFLGVKLLEKDIY